MIEPAPVTLTDDLGRKWTITIARAVVGFRYTVYIHNSEINVLALEHLTPGGVAHGWTDDDPETARDLLVAIMGVKGAVCR
jgi:hypothetical protein